MNKKIKKFLKNSIIYSAIIGIVLLIWKKVKNHTDKLEAVKIEKKDSSLDDNKATFYERVIKRGLDIILSFCGIVVLSPLFIILSVAIFIDDPGPVIFKQKRVGLNKSFFQLYKFRSMKMDTPHDIPTHQLIDPEQYITKVGKFLRKSSLDELPQLFNIFAGDISVVGPRPALWNQDDLIQERDLYDANSVMPGLTGYAQINGRDELEIPIKAKYDGKYVSALRKSSVSGMIMDIKCFFGTFVSVIKSDGVVEGGTGELNKDISKDYYYPDVDTQIGFQGDAKIDYSVHRKVLITGANSYIGESFEKYAKEHYGDNFEIDTIDMIDGSWKEKSFAGYDTVFHVAGIAHADVGNVSDDVKRNYYEVNTKLAVETAQKAKKDGVKQFVFMSSIIIYGESAPYGREKMITADTKPSPANFYGDSKWQADKGVRGLASDEFNVLVLRPPMIYGKGSKGNYPILVRAAKLLPVFPNINNNRSMLYIENLCEFLCKVILVGKGGVFFPQNSEYTRTSDMVKVINNVYGKKIIVTALLNPFVWIGSKLPGKSSELVNKVFGNCSYDIRLSDYGIEYQYYNVKESIDRSERKEKKALVLASVASMIDQFNMPNIELLQSLNYKVDVAANFTNPGTITFERAETLNKHLNERGVQVFDVAIPRSLSPKAILLAYKQVKNLLNKEDYSILHCQSPIGGAIARFAAKRKKHLTVIYTAHGFHFYDGAPLKNWIIFYPVEKYLSKYTDILITINKEDYYRAQKSFKAKKMVYIPGVGVDTDKFQPRPSSREKIRTELGIDDSVTMLLSVGELNENKNHISVIRAIKDMNIVYVIVGKGEKKDELELEAKKTGVDVRLVGFRNDVADFYDAADAYVLPSIREGLNVSLMEAMATGLAVACGRIRGNLDLIDDEKCFFDPRNTNDIRTAIEYVIEDRKCLGEKNLSRIHSFDLVTIRKLISEVYRGI